MNEFLTFPLQEAQPSFGSILLCCFLPSFLIPDSRCIHPSKHSSLFLHLRPNILPSVFYLSLPGSNLSCTNTPEVFIPLPLFVPFNGFRICPSSVHPSVRERASGKPLETPQTGGCGIGRGVDKGESFQRFITQRSHRTVH